MVEQMLIKLVKQFRYSMLCLYRKYKKIHLLLFQHLCLALVERCKGKINEFYFTSCWMANSHQR